MADIPGSLRYLDLDSHMAWLAPPPDDGQRYLLMYDFTQTRPAWNGLGGLGLSYGNQFCGSTL